MEREFKHTSGPWFPVEYAGYWSVQNGPYYEDHDILDQNKCDRAEANAKLAAASPDLLKACKMALGMTNYIPIELESQVKGIEKVLRDAINKATS